LASADIDNDGDVDLILRSADGGLYILRNDGGNRNHSLKVDVHGHISNRSAVEAKIEMRAGSLYQKLEVYSASPAPAPAPTAYVYSGTVTDGIGRPVVGATVRGGPDSGVTDANGRYEFRSPYSPPVPGNVYPPAGYERKPAHYYESVPLTPGQNFTIRRITSVSISPPPTITVGGHQSLEPRIAFDTGQVEAPVFDYFDRSVSDPTVLRFLGVFGALVEGVKPGTVSVSGSYFGVSAPPQQIQVAP
jgi:hypothetical protein